MEEQYDIISCGCSFTQGLYFVGIENDEVIHGFNKPWVSFLAEYLNKKLLNISRPGASNYHIIKQVEYGISLNPKLLLINTTTVDRLDVVLENKDFNLYPPKLEHFVNTTKNDKIGIIKSSPISAIHRASKKSIYYEKLLRYYIEYCNSHILKDQQRLMFEGIIKKLEEKQCNYLILDFVNLLEKDEKIIKIFNFDHLSKIYANPSKDMHWNEDGHIMIAKYVREYLSKKL